MVKLILAIAGAVGALAGLLTVLYQTYFSPAAKRKREALKNGKEAVDKGDVSAITSAFDKLRKRILPIILLFALAGCRQLNVVIHPIEQTDIIRVKQGETLIAPKDGYFLSDRFVKDVMEAKIE